MPSVSSAFRASGSDPKELRGALTDLGRFAETTRDVHKAHWQRMDGLSQAIDEARDDLTQDIDRATREIGVDIETLKVDVKDHLSRILTKLTEIGVAMAEQDKRIMRLEWRAGLFGLIGAGVGGILCSIITALILSYMHLK